MTILYINQNDIADNKLISIDTNSPNNPGIKYFSTGGKGFNYLDGKNIIHEQGG